MYKEYISLDLALTERRGANWDRAMSRPQLSSSRPGLANSLKVVTAKLRSSLNEHESGVKIGPERHQIIFKIKPLLVGSIYSLCQC